ncbi:hypothetical protein BDP27DRAFT_1297156 [Rhodocollybia butyracea]|uniref:Protein kinase domain-containing protein n=1 Tax=Rhodocollybia butyracea TaxID=206335 RepID=A0A9P5PRE4_9AGAR|nr:hypothetical protein BDP27DRAFT_1297156 [Rhodocollybia butyracea]
MDAFFQSPMSAPSQVAATDANALPQTDAEAQSLNLEYARLEDYEEFWRDHYHWLKDKGYQLRPRYHPDWVHSWKGTKTKSYALWRFEDHHVAPHPLLMDAVHIRDQKVVMLRRPDPESLSDERKIGRPLSSESTISDTRNHCVPIYETLELDTPDPDGWNLIVVMPCLVRWEIILEEFNSVGEVVDFCGQIFEGLQFMHSLNVAHNDAKDTNIMMDWYPMFKDPPHPFHPYKNRDWSGNSKPRSRTLHPIKYYWIDYDMSKQYEPNSSPLQPSGYGGDQSVPEFRRNELCNPFKVDVYCAGNVIRTNFLAGIQHFVEPRDNLEFLNGLISDMTHDDPLKRPSMDAVISRFTELCKGLHWWQLRSRVPPKNEHPLMRLFLTPTHWVKQVAYILLRIPPVPDYRKRK